MKRKNNKKVNAGFTLLEVMLSVAILAIVTIPLLKYFTDSLKNTAIAARKQKATLVAQETMEFIKSQDKMMEKVVDKWQAASEMMKNFNTKTDFDIESDFDENLGNGTMAFSYQDDNGLVERSYLLRVEMETDIEADKVAKPLNYGIDEGNSIVISETIEQSTAVTYFTMRNQAALMGDDSIFAPIASDDEGGEADEEADASIGGLVVPDTLETLRAGEGEGPDEPATGGADEDAGGTGAGAGGAGEDVGGVGDGAGGAGDGAGGAGAGGTGSEGSFTPPSDVTDLTGLIEGMMTRNIIIDITRTGDGISGGPYFVKATYKYTCKDVLGDGTEDTVEYTVYEGVINDLENIYIMYYRLQNSPEEIANGDDIIVNFPENFTTPLCLRIICQNMPDDVIIDDTKVHLTLSNTLPADNMPLIRTNVLNAEGKAKIETDGKIAVADMKKLLDDETTIREFRVKISVYEPGTPISTPDERANAVPIAEMESTKIE